MGKIGVGVGEDFPVDEGAQESVAGEKPCGGRREALRQRREQKRQWRRQMHAEWHAHKDAMRDRLRREFHDEKGAHHARHLALGALAVIGLAALLGHRHHDH